jgi:hypothetical protein
MIEFCESCDKVVYGLKHTLKFVGNFDDSDSIFRVAGVSDGKVILDKLSWVMPEIYPSDEETMKIYKTFIDKVEVKAPVRYRLVNQ